MKSICVLACVAASLSAAASGKIYGDTPDSRHAWSVHDMNRPYPANVKALPGKPPSDAIVLFDGTQESVDRNWTSKDGSPIRWKAENGCFVCLPKSGPACTRRPFGDAQFHIEWMAPLKDSRENGTLAGNSGVFPMGMHEVQILNSFDPDPGNPAIERNYPDGIAGSVYAENPPLVNASLPAGEWQSYDIIFHQPIWENGKVKYPGSLTVFHNGVLVQDNWELEGLTTHRIRKPLKEYATKLPWQLQDHGDPVPFRNIWIREIPSRYANTTHGGPAANEADVMKLRRETASKLFAKIDCAKADAATIYDLLEVIQYANEAPYRPALEKAMATYIATLEAKAAKDLTKDEAEGLRQVRRGIDVLLRNKVLPNDWAPKAKLAALAKNLGVK